MSKKCSKLVLNHPKITVTISLFHHFILPGNQICRSNLIHPLLPEIWNDMRFDHISLISESPFFEFLGFVIKVHF